MALKKVIVVGAGPSGLLLGLLRSQQGIQVDLLDANSTVNKQPPPAHYASPASSTTLDPAGQGNY